MPSSCTAGACAFYTRSGKYTRLSRCCGGICSTATLCGTFQVRTCTRCLHFALDGITAFSNLPLRWAFYIGIVFGMCSILLLGHVFYVKFVTNDAVPGWATTTVSVLFLGGIQLVGIGILGEYIGRIFEEIQHRPLYLVARHLQNCNKINENKAK